MCFSIGQPFLFSWKKRLFSLQKSQVAQIRSGNSKVDGDVGPPQRVAGNQTGNNGQQEGHTYSAHLHRKEPLDAPSQGPQNAGSTFFAFLFLPSSGHIQGKSPQD